MRAEDKIRAVFALPLGFSIGLVLAGLAQLFVVGSSKVALILGGGLALLFLANMVMDRLGDWMFAGAVKRWGRKDGAVDAGAGRTLVPLYLFLAGVAAGLGAAAIWPISDILALIS